MHHLLSLLCRLYCFLLAPSAAHYINGGPSLPPPLTPEQEKSLLTRMMAGDAAARDDLITHNLRLVVYIARKFENTGVGVDDLISIGSIGLIKAVSTFDAHKKIKLATYASRCIENEILMYLRRYSRTKDFGAKGGGLARRADQHRLGRQRAAALGRDGHRSRSSGERAGDGERPPRAARGHRAAQPARKAHHADALRPERPAGKNPARGRGNPRHFTILHFSTGKAHLETVAR